MSFNFKRIASLVAIKAGLLSGVSFASSYNQEEHDIQKATQLSLQTSYEEHAEKEQIKEVKKASKFFTQVENDQNVAEEMQLQMALEASRSEQQARYAPSAPELPEEMDLSPYAPSAPYEDESTNFVVNAPSQFEPTAPDLSDEKNDEDLSQALQVSLQTAEAENLERIQLQKVIDISINDEKNIGILKNTKNVETIDFDETSVKLNQNSSSFGFFAKVSSWIRSFF